MIQQIAYNLLPVLSMGDKGPQQEQTGFTCLGTSQHSLDLDCGYE